MTALVLRAVALSTLPLAACAKRTPAGAAAGAADAPAVPGSFPALREVPAASPPPASFVSGPRFWQGSFTSDGKRLLALHMEPDGNTFRATSVVAFDPLTAELQASWPLPEPLSAADRLTLHGAGPLLTMTHEGTLYVSRDGSPLTPIPDLPVRPSEVAVYPDGILVRGSAEAPLWSDGITHTVLEPCASINPVLFAADTVLCTHEDLSMGGVALVDPTSGALRSSHEDDDYRTLLAASIDGRTVLLGGAERAEVHDLDTGDGTHHHRIPPLPYQVDVVAGSGAGEHWVIQYQDNLQRRGDESHLLFLAPNEADWGEARAGLRGVAVDGSRGMLLTRTSLEHVDLNSLLVVDGAGPKQGGQLVLEADGVWTLAPHGAEVVATRWDEEGVMLGRGQRDRGGELHVDGGVDPVRAAEVLASYDPERPTPTLQLPSGVENDYDAVGVGEIGALVPGAMVGVYRTFWQEGEAVQEGATLVAQDWMGGQLQDAAYDEATGQVVLSFEDWVGWWPLEALKTPTPPWDPTGPAMPYAGIHALYEGPHATFDDRPDAARAELSEKGWLPSSIDSWVVDALADLWIDERWREVGGVLQHERTMTYRSSGSERRWVPDGFSTDEKGRACRPSQELRRDGAFESSSGETLCIQQHDDRHNTVSITHAEDLGVPERGWAAGVLPHLRAHPETEPLAGAVAALAGCVQAVELTHHVVGGAVQMTVVAKCPRVERARLQSWCEANGLSGDRRGGCHGDIGYTTVNTEHYGQQMWIDIRL